MSTTKTSGKLAGVESVVTVLTGILGPGALTTISTAIIGKALQIGGKKARLQAIEIGNLVSADYSDVILKALDGRADETSMAVMKALAEAQRRNSLTFAKLADLDGSIK
jgi:hypothetical protein